MKEIAVFEATVPQRPAGAVESCLRAIERVEQIVEQETQALRRREHGGLADFNHKKSHGLLDLTRAIRALGAAGAQSLAPRLQALQAKLKENAGLLQMHQLAVQEISAVMARAIRESESDGTYSAAARFAGARK